jgi:hypothetical protein
MNASANKPFESEDWLNIKDRCEAAGITVEEREYILPTGESGETVRREYAGILNVPNGNSSRRIHIYSSSFSELRTIDFENYALLGDYYAVWSRVTNAIEARIDMASSRTMLRVLATIPGFEDLDHPSKGDATDDGSIESDPATSHNDTHPRNRIDTLPKNWRIRATRGTASIEMSPATPWLRLFAGGSGRATLKLNGLDLQNYTEALEALEDLSNAFCFELDVRTNIRLTLDRVRPLRTSLPRSAISDAPLSFPKSVYPKEPIELYQYGRSSSGLPLLQFLAYYQVVEFFFPVYSRQEAMRRLRLAIKDPRFDVNDDVSLNKVLTATIPEGRVGEREQLRATLRACMEPSMIREVVESSEAYSKHFTSKDQAIRGASRILLHPGQPDLRDQAAERIYAIRCRVVHTKQDGAEDSIDLLLPSSPEARSMRPDVELMRSVAQRVLTASSRTLRPKYL